LLFDGAGHTVLIDTGEAPLPPAEEQLPALHGTVDRALRLIEKNLQDGEGWLIERTAWRYRRMATTYWHAIAQQQKDARQAQHTVTDYLEKYGHELEDLLPRIGSYIARAPSDEFLDEDPFNWYGDLLDIDTLTHVRPFAALLLELFPGQENVAAQRWVQRINALPTATKP